MNRDSQCNSCAAGAAVATRRRARRSKVADAARSKQREAARDGNWSIHWEPLDDCCRKALAADGAGNYAEAIRHYCRGITFVMNELRKQPPKRSNDSALED